MEENILISEFSKNWKWDIIKGIVSIIFGIIVIIYPFTAAIWLALFYGAFIFADGVFAILTIFASRAVRVHYWLFLIKGIVGIAVGMLIFILPKLSLLSIYAMFFGILYISIGISMRIKHLVLIK